MKILPLVKFFFKKNPFIHFGFLLTALHLSNGFVGYIYQVIMGRILQPSEFALLSSTMAFFMFLSAPMSAISILIVRRVSAYKAHDNLRYINSFLIFVSKILLTISIIILFVLYIGRFYLQSFLKFETLTPIFIFILILVGGLFINACAAFIQGLQRFIFLGLFSLFGVVCKLIFGLVLVKLGYGINGALFGVLLGMILIFVCSVPILIKSFPQQIRYQSIRLSNSFLKSSVPILIATVTFAGMTQLDMILVNWYFSPDQAGQYAAASVLGKAVLYIPGGFVLAFFPMVAEKDARGENSFTLFHQAIIVTIILCGTSALVYWFFGVEIISFLYGENYKGAGEILSWYGIAILPLSIVIIIEQYLIAKGKFLYAWILLLIIPIEIALIYFFHSELWMILTIMGCIGCFLAIIGFTIIWFWTGKSSYK